MFQNWRHDAVMVLKSNAEQVEHARYSAYGVRFGLPASDARAIVRQAGCQPAPLVHEARNPSSASVLSIGSGVWTSTRCSSGEM